jgi:hypothetical protein
MNWLKSLIEKLFNRKPKPKPAPVPPAPAQEPKPETKPEPEKPPAPAVHPDHVNWYRRTNKGGHGLYKPWDYHAPDKPGNSNLWLLPARNPTNGAPMRPSQLGVVGQYLDAECTMMIGTFRWPSGVGAMSDKPTNGSHTPSYMDDSREGWYHGDRIKIRGAKADRDGVTFGAFDVFGQLLFKKTIIERNVRQE